MTHKPGDQTTEVTFCRGMRVSHRQLERLSEPKVGPR